MANINEIKKKCEWETKAVNAEIEIRFAKVKLETFCFSRICFAFDLRPDQKTGQ